MIFFVEELGKFIQIYSTISYNVPIEKLFDDNLVFNPGNNVGTLQVTLFFACSLRPVAYFNSTQIAITEVSFDCWEEEIFAEAQTRDNGVVISH